MVRFITITSFLTKNGIEWLDYTKIHFHGVIVYSYQNNIRVDN